MALPLLYVSVPESSSLSCSEGRERLSLSGCFESVPEMIKVPSSPPGNRYVVGAGDEVHCRDVKGK